MNVHSPNEGDPLMCFDIKNSLDGLKSLLIFGLVVAIAFIFGSSVHLLRTSPLGPRCFNLARFMAYVDMAIALLSTLYIPFTVVMAVSLGKACGMWDWKEDLCATAGLTPFKGSLFEEGACTGQALFFATFALLIPTTGVFFGSAVWSFRVLLKQAPSEDSTGLQDAQVYGNTA